MRARGFYLLACVGLLGLAVIAWEGEPWAAIGFGLVVWFVLTLFAMEEARYED